MTASVDNLLDTFLTEVDTALIGSYSAVLYGSAVRGHYVAGHSDVNLMLVLDRVSPEALRSLSKAFAIWRKAKQPPPLLMSRAEWSRSADAFPIEITDMKNAYKVLRGTDPLKALQVNRRDLRRALEREFRGKLMRLRQGFVLCAGDPGDLAALARESARSLLVLLRSLVTLSGKPAPHDPVALVGAAAQAAGFDPTVLALVAEHRASRGWRCSPQQFAAYLDTAEAAARFLDQLPSGER